MDVKNRVAAARVGGEYGFQQEETPFYAREILRSSYAAD
jgi:hypothetical protein